MSSHLRRFTPALLGLFALVLGLIGAGSKSFWYDEGFSAQAIRLSPGELLSLTIHHDPHTGFYHLFLKSWQAIGGDSEFWLRSFSAVCGALATMMFFVVAKRLYGYGIALTASLGMVVSGFYLAYAQEARPYAFTLLFTCLGMWTFIRAVDANRIGAWLLWGVAVGVGVYAHPFTAGVAIAQVLSLGVLPGIVGRLRGVIFGGVTAAALVAPWLVMVVIDSNNHLSWVPPLGTQPLGYVAHQITGNGPYVMSAVMILLIGVFAVATLQRLRKSDRSTEAWHDVLTLGWATVLPLAAVLASIYSSFLVPRYFISAFPGVILATVVAVWRLRGKLRPAVAGFLVICAIYSAGNWYVDDDSKDDWREAVDHVIDQRKPGDGIVFARSSRLPFEYYMLRSGVEAGDSPRPISPQRDWGSDLPNTEVYRDFSSEQKLDEAVASYDRVWVVYLKPIGIEPDIRPELVEDYGAPTVEEFPRAVVELYT